MKPSDFRGAYTALITPFRNGAVDYAHLNALVEEQIQAGIAGLVAVGTTGESPTLAHDEHIAVIQAVVEAARGRVPVIAGTGANATREALDLVREAEAVGASAHLQVAPYYNKPSQEGLYQHFAQVAEATRLPVILYSVPGRCGIEIGVEVVQRLAERYPHLRCIKEAGGNVARVSQLRAACGNDLTILCGDDGLTLPFMVAGATGVISVASNLAPQIIVDLCQAALDGCWTEAQAIHDRYYGLLTDLVFIEGNPVSIKAALHEAGKLPSEELRLPLVPCSARNREKIRQTVFDLQLHAHA